MTLLNLFEYEEAARERMATPYYEYYAGGVGDNVTLRDNRAAFERLRLRPRFRALRRWQIHRVTAGTPPMRPARRSTTSESLADR